MNKTVCVVLSALIPLSAYALDLSIPKDDVLIEQSVDGGYNLYIKKKPDIQSVLLTETTKDPKMAADNYAYRAAEWNATNGDEKRMLDGAFIPPEKKIYSLISSTVVKDTPIGDAFHIWIPYVIRYGYSWSRNGEIQVVDGTYINIRAFSMPYADYSGSFADNPYKLKLTQKPVERIEAAPKGITYMKDTVSTFSEIATTTKGKILYAKDPEDIVNQIKDALEPAGPKSLDLALVVDATESMSVYVGAVRKTLQDILKDELPKYPSWRVALVLYKDYSDDFLVRDACPFTTDLVAFRKALGSFYVGGGGDIPEAVYEGLDGALKLPWNPDAEKKIILIGDAPPHPKPRGSITKEMVQSSAAEKGVQMNVIILPGHDTY